MAPITLAMDTKSSSLASSDVHRKKTKIALAESRKPFASVSIGEEKPFDFLRTLFEGVVIAGGTSGVVADINRNLTDPENAVIGAFAGAQTGAITTPLDVIKTRLMVQGSANQYNGIFNCVRTIVREERSSTLLKGIGPRVLWIGIGGSIFFGVLERTKQFLVESQIETLFISPLKLFSFPL